MCKPQERKKIGSLGNPSLSGRKFHNHVGILGVAPRVGETSMASFTSLNAPDYISCT